MNTPTKPDRITSTRATQDWAVGVLAPDDDLRVHADLPGWVEVALRCAPVCCETFGDPGPAWTWLERRGGDVDAIGYRSARCGVCGRDGGNWVTSGALELTDDERQDAARLRKRVEDLHLERHDRAVTL